MAVYFVDSSALVKRYISETGSTWVLSLFDPALNNDILIAAITGVEIVAAITRRARSGSISAANAMAACNQYNVLGNEVIASSTLRDYLRYAARYHRDEG